MLRSSSVKTAHAEIDHERVNLNPYEIALELSGSTMIFPTRFLVPCGTLSESLHPTVTMLTWYLVHTALRVYQVVSILN